MNKLKYLIILIIPLLLSGCYNYQELNELAITTGISIDYDKETDNFKVLVQVINPVKEQDAKSGSEPSFINYKSEGKSLREAIRLVIKDSPQKLYGAQLQVAILSENVLNEKLPDVIDFFIREPELRTEFKVIIAKDTKAVEGISVQTLLSDLSSSNILDSLETQIQDIGITTVVSLNELTNMYLNPYLEIVLPSMIVVGDLDTGTKKENLSTTNSETTVEISTTGVFNDNKFLGYLTEEESKTLNLIRGDIKNTIINMDINDGFIVFEPNRIKVETEAKVKDNTVKISIRGYAKVKEITGLADLTSEKEVKKLEKVFNKLTEEMVHKTFESIREKYNTDVFKFRDLYYKTDPKYFKKNYDNWYEDIFPSLKLEVKSEIKLYEKGNTLGGTKYEREN